MRDSRDMAATSARGAPGAAASRAAAPLAMPSAMVVAALAAAVLAACGGGGGGGAPQPGTAQCSIEGQKQFVLDQMRDIYFWNDLLPAQVDLADFETPEELLAFLTSFQPLDRFSFIDSLEADQQFFGEGRFAGFGFSSRISANDEVRFTRVFTDSPANRGGLARGQRLLEVDGRPVAEIIAAEGLSEAFGPAEVGVTRRLRIRRLDDTEFEVDLTKDVVTIDPLPQNRLIDDGSGGQIGYFEFATFVGTAETPLQQVFDGFRNASVTDLVIDMRYNGGGLVSIAELLGDYLGGEVSAGEVFSRTLFNDDNADQNRTEFFEQLAESLNLSRLVVIGTASTASASEQVINGMEPHVEVTIVGDDTFGKPVGQVGIEFCEKILRPTAFETVNSLNEGGFFDGLPVDCPAPDDLGVPVGDDADPALQTALSFLADGACPPPSQMSQKQRPPRERWRARETAAGVYAGAY